MLLRRRTRKRERSRGIAALELAMSLAFLVPLLCGLLNFGYYFYIGSNAEAAARIGVRRAVRLNNGSVCTNAATVATVRADGMALAIGTGVNCNGGGTFSAAAACHMNDPPLSMGAAGGYTTVTLDCLNAPVDPSWRIYVDVDFPPAMNFLSWLFPTRSTGKVWYRATLVSN